MTALLKGSPYITVEEYLEGEEFSEIRHEYYDGAVTAMAGGTSRHNAATGYFFRKIADKLQGGPCQVFMSDFKVRTPFVRSELFYYPDVFVACEPDDNHRLYRNSPKFWLEVMSNAEDPGSKDRVEKYLVARRMPSMEEYVLVSPDPKKPEVSVFRRDSDWEPPEVVREGEVTLTSIDVTVSIDELYESLAQIEMTG
ncbi:MAG: Uma2 family endonuclease [Verrucomicrobiota bacterium]